jgi:hypothetical protein
MRCKKQLRQIGVSCLALRADIARGAATRRTIRQCVSYKDFTHGSLHNEDRPAFQ